MAIHSAAGNAVNRVAVAVDTHYRAADTLDDVVARYRWVGEQIRAHFCLVCVELLLKFVGERTEFRDVDRFAQRFSLINALRTDRQRDGHHRACRDSEPIFHVENP